MNIQDLQTISQDKVNVVISVINNNGYAAIRHTQKEFLGGNYYGTHPKWSLQMPSIGKLAAAFEIPYILLKDSADLDSVVVSLVSMNGPVICEVVTNEDQEVLFKQGYKANEDGTFSPQNLSEMHPFIES
jgi:acetolactate synthase-1/2/3 large subunit